jgi:hypothetical protein
VWNLAGNLQARNSSGSGNQVFGIRLETKFIFPAILFVCNLGSAAASAAAGDWRRAAYWVASSVCIASVSL